MPIRVVCPEGHKILAPESRAGQRIRCPRCRSELRVPSLPATNDDASEEPAKAANKQPPPPKKAAVTKKESAGPASSAKKSRWKGDPSEVASTPDASAKAGSDSKPAKQPSVEKSATPPPPPIQNTPPPVKAETKKAEKPTPPPRKSPPPLPTSRKEEPATKPTPPKPAPPKPSEPVAEKPAAKTAPAKPSAPTSVKAETAQAKKTASSEEQPTAAVAPPAPPPQPPSTDAAEGDLYQPPAPTEIEQTELPQEEVAHDDAIHEEPVESALPVIGVRHRPERVRTVYYLALVLGGLALFGMIPAAMEWLDYLQFEGEHPLARWAWFVMGLGLLQIAYAVYLFQMPDWSTVWSTAIAVLGSAMLYAMLYAVTLLGDADSQLLAWLEIHVTQTSRASGWCFVMLSLCGIYAYFCGRAGANWRHSEQLRANLGLK